MAATLASPTSYGGRPLADTENGGTDKTAVDQAGAVALMLEKEKHEICRGLFHGLERSR